MKMKLVAPCHFGMEAVLKREIYDLGYDISSVSDGRVCFEGDSYAVALANIFLRTTERVMIEVGNFKATTYDELFEGVKALDWHDYIPEDGKFWVTKASSVKSALFSPRDIQSIVKKAIVDKLGSVYHKTWFDEKGAQYPIRVSINKDIVSVMLDTSGVSLHKRGYRKAISKAPISETLASGLIMLSPWNINRTLVDPFCGCGTIPIEAAMIGCNIAPGMNRKFTAMNWENLISKSEWTNAIEEANDKVSIPKEINISGYDLDPKMIDLCRENLKALNRLNLKINFKQGDIKDLKLDGQYGFVITNPPYGERLEDTKTIEPIYKSLGSVMKDNDTWSYFVITSYEDIERQVSRRATKNRKIYNGMIKTYYYQFMGPKPNGVKI